MNALGKINALARKAGMEVDDYLLKLGSDPVFFVHQLWIDRKLDSKGPIGPAEEEMIYFAADASIPKKGILAPRGIGKTYFIVCALICWDLYRDAEQKIFLVSKSEPHAKKSLFMIKAWLKYVCFLSHLHSDEGRKGRWAEDEIDVQCHSLENDDGAQEDRTPSITTAGIDGALPGSRAHKVYVDDVEMPTNTKTITARAYLAQQVKEFSAIASYGDGEVVYVGTPHHEQSLYVHLNRLINELTGLQLYPFRTWTIQLPTPEECNLIIGLAPSLTRMLEGGAKPGTPVFPDRMPPSFIADKQGEGKSYFAMQFMLIASLSNELRYPLKLSDLIVFHCDRDKAPHSIQWGSSDHRGQRTDINDIENLGFAGDVMYAPIMHDPEWTHYRGTKMWVDPSAEGEDHTAWAIVSHLNGRFWVKCVDSDHRGHTNEVLHRICIAARQHFATEIYIEKNMGGTMFSQLLEQTLFQYYLRPGDEEEYPDGWGCHIVKDHDLTWSKHQKELTIIGALEGPMNNHRLVIDPRVLIPDYDYGTEYQLQYQLTHLTRQRDCLRHDDKIESLGRCIACWAGSMNLNPEMAAERSKELEKQKKIDAWWKDAGYNKTGTRWFSHS